MNFQMNLYPSMCLKDCNTEVRDKLHFKKHICESLCSQKSLNAPTLGFVSPHKSLFLSLNRHLHVRMNE